MLSTRALYEDRLGMLSLDSEDDAVLTPVAEGNRPTEPLDGTDVTPKTVDKGSIPRIRVIIRKRPLTGKEMDKGENNILDVHGKDATIVVNEPKCRVDLTKYTEEHAFKFDACLDEHVGNDAVYCLTVKPLIDTIMDGGYATCFAYGQTGSGKTYTMQPLPVRAAVDILTALAQPSYHNLQLFVSCFEIYGGKVYDLLNARKRLEVREDGRKKVCIVGLKDFKISNVEAVEYYIQHSNSARSTGTTGANADSSRSHSIMQFSLQSQSTSGRQVTVQEHGKLSFIDLAGSERGADTSDSNRQTRMEGAEINKSLLALKECIRALDNVARHVPFRGSKLTEVLRDSFLGESARTVMIANVSPSSASCEHTLNTLRYANRVKELRRDSTTSCLNVDCVAGPPAITSTANIQGKVIQEPSAHYQPVGKPDTAVRPRPVQASLHDKARPQSLSTSPRAGDAQVLASLDNLIGLHRRQIEKDMATVRKEMSLLTQVDQVNSTPQAYIHQLLHVIQDKAQGIQLLAQQAELCAELFD